MPVRVWRRVRRRGWSLAAWFWMAAAGAAAGAAIWFTTGWLLHTTGQVMDRDAKATGADRARVRVEAVRTGLAAGAGAGAAVGLMLAFRRQAHTEHDTAERRVTELYNAAAEQLGSDKAPVRLTALYTLERLADDNRRHRQTIVNIICAYLRMPCAAPAEQPDHGEGQRQAVRRYQAARAGRPAPQPPSTGPHPDPHEERQVRLTAQRILHTHLRPDAETPWTGITVDLTGATLIDFTLTGCTVHEADFNEATFTGTADFNGATFTGLANFSGATFTGLANFSGATFTSAADFNGAAFTGADFSEATFTGTAYFNRATFTRTYFSRAIFTGGADFIEATFTSLANFNGATFTSLANFNGVAFTGLAYFNGATFTGAYFTRATFTGTAHFAEATFTGLAYFNGATFTGADFIKATFTGADFNGATFTGRADFSRATFTGVDFEGASVADRNLAHVLPADWRIEPDEGASGRLMPVTAPAPPSGA
ncbi:pentapeptide repeat-containing protein [Actinomadura graeca]|uniref:Pentapeptide repeat-containing protein n=1 Tax=Actinomadura graeca TaxID=2750812 RepID=A0ABX8R811_9ACTN|nr:pentapeptide repeat-containing protein [Actinomadura graeca]QXJ25902.1 pentapeptide repeat-containing protein [Actinomadura graeca]